MVALDLGIFSEKEQQMMDYIDEQNQMYEREYEQKMQEREKEIGEYVMQLSKAELREKLIQRMIMIYIIRILIDSILKNLFLYYAYNLQTK